MFIDEESTQHDEFENHFEKYWPEANVRCVFPSSTLNEMLEEIEQWQPNAIIVDFQLNDKKTDIKYIAYIVTTIVIILLSVIPMFLLILSL